METHRLVQVFRESGLLGLSIDLPYNTSYLDLYSPVARVNADCGDHIHPKTVQVLSWVVQSEFIDF
jgi:hypothetical protein